jgi:heat shock protein HslJ
MRWRFAVFLLAILPTHIVGAAEPVDNFRGDWLVARINGEAPVAPRLVTLRIAADGRIAGHAPCNIYRAHYRLSEGRVDFTPGMTTRMFCGPEIMRQEQVFLSLFSGGATWRVTGAGLTLEGDNGVSIEARRAEKRR